MMTTSIDACDEELRAHGHGPSVPKVDESGTHDDTEGTDDDEPEDLDDGDVEESDDGDADADEPPPPDGG